MKKAKFLVLILVAILAIAGVMFVACPSTGGGTTDTTTTTVEPAAAQLYFRGNFTAWSATDDARLQFRKYSDGSYRATVDFGPDGLNYSGRPRFKFVHNEVGSDWVDDQTINGYDPANPGGDPETDLLGQVTPPPKEEGKVIAKIKGGLNNLTVYEKGGKYEFILTYLVVPEENTTDWTQFLQSTHSDEYVLIDTKVIRHGTYANPPDRIDATVGLAISGAFNSWASENMTHDAVNKKFIAIETISVTGDYGFGILNNNWDNKWTGVTFTAPGDLGSKTLVAGHDNNNLLSIPDGETGTYTFEVDYSDIFNPKLTITKD